MKEPSTFDHEAMTGGLEPGEDEQPAALGDTFEDLVQDEETADPEADDEEK